jgi:hypothetical protein
VYLSLHEILAMRVFHHVVILVLICYLLTSQLEPVISGEIMQLHHSKHHNAYVTNLNVAMAKLDEATHKGDISGIVSAQAAIKFNGACICSVIFSVISYTCSIN